MISLITVCRNSAATIGDCVASVYEQIGYAGGLEHLVIDGASTDGTCELVRAVSGGRSQLLSEPDTGIYDAMNKGLALARGELIGCLNSDDRFAHSGVLAAVEGAFAEDPALELVHSGLVYVEKDDPSRVVRRWPARSLTRADFLRGILPPHPTIYFRRSLLERTGVFDTRYRIASDTDWILRALVVQQARQRCVEDTWIRMRLGGVSNRSLRHVWRSSAEFRDAMRRAGFPNVWLSLFRCYVYKLRQRKREAGSEERGG